MTTRALFTYTALILFIFSSAAAARAQDADAPKVEIGVQYTSLSFNLPVFGGTQNAPGVGARVTYNLNDFFAVEAEGNIFPSTTPVSYVAGGDVQQAQFGVKVGKRWRSFGLFAKARPGFVSFSETLAPPPDGVAGQFGRERKTHFSADVGGVLEFYVSRRLLVRVDAGDTIIRYGEHDELQPVFLPSTGSSVSFVSPAPSETRHNFQFTAGVGFRFGGGSEKGGAAPSSTSASARERPFEAGVQFSSLILSMPQRILFFGGPPDDGVQAEAGFGGRLGYNVSDALALEAEGNFYPRRRLDTNPGVGGYPSQMQFGAKVGRRFERFGVFAKARPGFVSFSAVPFVTATQTETFGGQQFVFATSFERERRTYFSMDLGGVVEFYHTRRWLTRFDLGDTMIRYGDSDSLDVSPAGASRIIPGGLRHSLQFTAGLGLRF